MQYIGDKSSVSAGVVSRKHYVGSCKKIKDGASCVIFNFGPGARVFCLCDGY